QRRFPRGVLVRKTPGRRRGSRGAGRRGRDPADRLDVSVGAGSQPRAEAGRDDGQTMVSGTAPGRGGRSRGRESEAMGMQGTPTEAARGLLAIHPEVQRALAAGEPVVALESSIIAQGMPYPVNVETARRVEAAIRDAGAVPATIALLDGRVRVGLDDEALLRLGQDPGAVKVAQRDVARVLVTGAPGGTTVSATAALARLAGIRVFATGGIGGAHRGGAPDFDRSGERPGGEEGKSVGGRGR